MFLTYFYIKNSNFYHSIHDEMPILFFRKYMYLYVPTKIMPSIH